MEVRKLHFEDTRKTLSAHDYLVDRFDRSLLVLGDLTAPLRRWTDALVARGDGQVFGVAVVFRGFAQRVATLVADDTRTAAALWDAVIELCGESVLLIVSDRQPPPEQVLQDPETRDPWMTRDTSGNESPPVPGLQPVEDASHLAPLYDARGRDSFWNPAMLDFGHYWGVFQEGSVVAVAGVDFVLENPSYAQIGNVVTLPKWQGKGLATACIRAVIESLHRAGIRRCGLFADGGSVPLVRLYRRLGFRRFGEFLFFGSANVDPL